MNSHVCFNDGKHATFKLVNNKKKTPLANVAEKTSIKPEILKKMISFNIVQKSKYCSPPCAFPSAAHKGSAAGLDRSMSSSFEGTLRLYSH